MVMDKQEIQLVIEGCEMSSDNRELVHTKYEDEAFNAVELNQLRKEYAAAHKKLTELGYEPTNKDGVIEWVNELSERMIDNVQPPQ